jgi:hypothetical protein
VVFCRGVSLPVLSPALLERGRIYLTGARVAAVLSRSVSSPL